MSNYTPNQQLAIETDKPKVIVTAGAGAGKTRVLTHRIRHLLQVEKFSQYDVLALTFTKYAAGEMKDRLDSMVDKLPWIGTFHAFALMILRKFGEIIHLRKDFDVITEIERDDILKELREKYKIKARDFNYRDEVFKDFHTPDIELLLKEYQSLLKTYGLIDFDLLLVWLKRLLEASPDVVTYLHRTYRHILIDEFQDTNRHVFGIVEMINPDNLFVVGDVDQCLYGFNGAEPEIMVGLAAQDEYTVYKLEENWRSEGDIVPKANQLIEHNIHRIDRTMIATQNIDDITVKQIITEDPEGDVCDVIERDQATETAILCRTNSDIHKIYWALSNRGIQAEKYDNSKQKKSFFLFMISAMRVIYNPWNVYSTKVVYRAYFPDNMLLFKKCQYKANELNDPVINVIADEVEFFKPLTERRQYAQDVYNTVIKNLPVGGLKFAENDSYDYLETLINEEPGIKLNVFLANISLHSLQDSLKRESDSMIRIMTVHGSKGLEFDRVVIFNAHHFPIKRKDSDPEEERRIFYVGMTRAKKELVIVGKPKTIYWEEIK